MQQPHHLFGDRTGASDEPPRNGALKKRRAARLPVYPPMLIEALIFGLDKGALKPHRDTVKRKPIRGADLLAVCLCEHSAGAIEHARPAPRAAEGERYFVKRLKLSERCPGDRRGAEY